jgi:hypothetical protein
MPEVLFSEKIAGRVMNNGKLTMDDGPRIK